MALTNQVFFVSFVLCFVIIEWATQERKILQTSSDWFQRTGHKLPTVQKKTIGPAFKQRAMAYIRHSEYRSAFNLVRKHSKGARKAWERAIKGNLRLLAMMEQTLEVAFYKFRF